MRDSGRFVILIFNMSVKSLFKTKTEQDIQAIYQHLNCLKENTEIAAEPKSFQCDICSNNFSSLLHLRRHRKSHTIEEFRRCYICNKMFSKRWNLKQHLRIHFGTKPFQCGRCDLSFRQKHHLRQHFAKSHLRETVVPQEIQPSTAFATFQIEQNSFQTTEATNALGNSKTNEVEFSGYEDSDNRQLSETTCDLDLDSVDFELRWLTCKENQCDGCNRVLPTTEKLKRHLVYVHKVPYQCNTCDTCSKLFFKKNTRDNQMKSHSCLISLESLRQCGLTPRQALVKSHSTKATHWTTHRKAHTAKKQHKCLWEGCCNKFADASPFEPEDHYTPDNNSINTIPKEEIVPPPTEIEKKKRYCLRPVRETGEHRFICTVCGKHYTTMYNIRKHRNVHTGSGLYPCGYCGRRFTHKHLLEVILDSLLGNILQNIDIKYKEFIYTYSRDHAGSTFIFSDTRTNPYW